ncbi:MAG: HPr(Ser) kinase/phosphatase [Deltaproteobacteria bacterium GWC2_42_11]|nr:MAG: HPr(Ser) kinase/phosphatase [Deltaproteobacteria bacterium GWC2_42_11]HBO83546.1 HPr(Ser) kinase/phosphatase [Deltaproteobacteria bacterium]
MANNIIVSDLLGEEIYNKLKLKAVSGERWLKKKVSVPRIQKPGLLLTCLLGKLHPDRILIFGKAELGYLKNLSVRSLEPVLRCLEKTPSPCYVVTRGQKVPQFLIDLVDKKKIPLLKTTLTSSIFIDKLTKYLDERLAPTMTSHGVFVDILGVGILIIGKSGIGKSECALDLITRGYRLVSDDIVFLKKMPPGIIFGIAADVIKYHMEVRGIGIINVKDIFGITAVREKKQMDIVVELVAWDPEDGYDRLGFDVGKYEILGIELPILRIPVSPGRSVATIVEVAARDKILKIMGHDSALEFSKKLHNTINSNRKG